MKTFKINKDVRLPGTDYILEKGDILIVKSLKENVVDPFIKKEWDEYVKERRSVPKQKKNDEFDEGPLFKDWLLKKYPDKENEIMEKLIDSSGPGSDYEHAFVNPQTHEEVLYAY